MVSDPLVGGCPPGPSPLPVLIHLGRGLALAGLMLEAFESFCLFGLLGSG